VRQRLLFACAFAVVLAVAVLPVHRFVIQSEAPRAPLACP